MGVVIMDFPGWRQELLFTGDIVQDDDPLVDPDEAARRCDRYLALLEAVDGTEGQEVFQTLVDSVQAKEDYELYEATLRVAFAFPPERLGHWLFQALPALLTRDPKRGEDWVRQVAYLGRRSSAVQALMASIAAAEEPESQLVTCWESGRQAAERLGYW